MEKITFDTYENAIQSFYLDTKLDDPTGRLQSISPAVFREICLSLYDSGLKAEDKIIFIKYFKVSAENDLRKAIEDFDLGRSKSVIKFIKGATSPTDSLRVEMAAILVGFKSRPYNNFLKRFPHPEEMPQRDDVKTAELFSTEKAQLVEQDFAFQGFIDDGKTNTKSELVEEKAKNKNKSGTPRLLYVLLAIITGSFLIYIVKKEIFPSKECLQWTSDHYEAVSCEGENIQTLYKAPIIKWNPDLVKFRKLDRSSRIQFFLNGKPAIWYSKINDTVEFYNAPGVHPITGKSLRPVTSYIVRKYGMVP